MRYNKYIRVFICINIIILLVLQSGCGSNKVIKKTESPNGKYQAIAFVRDLGATTAYSKQVSILRKGQIFRNSSKGNVFISENTRYLNIKWANNKKLVIYSDTKPQDIFLKKKSIYGIQVEFRKKHLK